MSIKLRDVEFNGDLVKINIKESKTKKRRVTLVESLPYLKEWITSKGLQLNDYLFSYKFENSLNISLSAVNQRLLKTFPKKWKHKKMYPHLFRHSRLTELAASGKANEALLRKFAGWEPGSSMARVYFHLDDSDVESMILSENGLKESQKPEIKKFTSKICKICNTENNAQNIVCWKCNNFLDKPKDRQLPIDLLVQPTIINEIKNENADLKTEIKDLKDNIQGLSKFMIIQYHSLMEAYRPEEYYKDGKKVYPDKGINKKEFKEFEKLIKNLK